MSGLPVFVSLSPLETPSKPSPPAVERKKENPKGVAFVGRLTSYGPSGHQGAQTHPTKLGDQSDTFPCQKKGAAPTLEPTPQAAPPNWQPTVRRSRSPKWHTTDGSPKKPARGKRAAHPLPVGPPHSNPTAQGDHRTACMHADWTRSMQRRPVPGAPDPWPTPYPANRRDRLSAAMPAAAAPRGVGCVL